ncbi:DUF1360 domain-containing protein [Paenibacillus yanchengensis]
MVILVFASFRLTHLLVFDNITWFLRKPFLLVNKIDTDDGRSAQQITVRGKGIRRFIGSLFICHWCMGIWSSALIITVYYLVPASIYILLILAIAGMAAFIESHLLKK